MYAVGAAVDRRFLPLLRRHQVQVVGGAAGGEGRGEHRVDLPRHAFVSCYEGIADVRRRDAPWAISGWIDEVVPVYRNPHHPTEAGEEAALELLEARRGNQRLRETDELGTTRPLAVHRSIRGESVIARARGPLR